MPDKLQDNGFARLVREHHRALIALAVPIVGASEAEEVVQNAWVKAYQAIDRFEGRAKIRTWLSRIVINEAKMQLRSRRREILQSDYDDRGDDAMADRFDDRGHWAHPPATWSDDAPEALLSSRTLQDCLGALFERMPDNQRIVLELRDSDGMSFDDICNDLAISASNARVLLHRARAQLYQLVDHYQETGEC